MNMATKKFWRGLLLVALAVCTTIAQAELYTWVDKNGKKHYGDKIPPEYAKQATAVEQKKINSMPTPPSVNFYQPPARNQDSAPAATDNTAPRGNSCEDQKRAFEESQACFNDCRLHRVRTHNVNNVSACGHCADVKKPNCD